jgi:DnaJ family protein C protein 28
MNIFEQIAEQRIREAQEAGAFNHLPGAGKPLKLEEDPFIPEDCRLAYHLLKEQGFSLPWLEQGVWLKREIENFRCALCSALAQAARSALEEKELRAETALQIAALNRRIMDYNLRTPALIFHQKPLDFSSEWAAAVNFIQES